MFYGFKTEDLLHGTIDPDGEVLAISLRRRRRTCGRHYHNRNQILRLPQKPRWFADLQDRFLDGWQSAYARTKATFPAKRLLLRRNGHSPRPLSEQIVLRRVYEATDAAIGRRVPPNVLRQTCGHLHTKNGDASLLTILGWSPQFSFQYTWLPRELHASEYEPRDIVSPMPGSSRT